MTTTVVRLRTMLFVPGHKAEWVPKAAAVRPDAIILDLEDAVPPASKAAAREGLTHAVAAVSDAGIHAVVRISALATAEGPHDVQAAVTAGAHAVMVPKVDSGLEVERLDAVLDAVEHLAGRDRRATRVVPTLESAAGLLAAVPIASAPRVEAVFAAAARDGDTARSVGFRWSAEGTETLAWRTHAVLACRAAGVAPIAGLWQEVGDLDGLRTWARGNRAIGFAGAAVIHPAHVAPCNAAFTPDPAEVAYYRGLLAAVEEARRRGSGAAVYRGAHVDAAHVATARAVVAAADDVDPSEGSG